MGTRGFIGFLTQDGLRGSYNHFDSYPSVLGKQVQEDLKEILEANKTVGDLATKVAEIRWVDPTDEPTEEDMATFADLRDKSVNGGQGWYSLLRKAQGSLALMAERRIATAEHDFPKDSLFCEWGYVIDLTAERDKNLALADLIVLRGFNRQLDRQAPFCRKSTKEIRADERDGLAPYYGCAIARRDRITDFIRLDMDAYEEEVRDAEEKGEH